MSLCLSPAPALQGLCGAKESGSLAARIVAPWLLIVDCWFVGP